jgi:hypothetical protein
MKTLTVRVRTERDPTATLRAMGAEADALVAEADARLADRGATKALQEARDRVARARHGDGESEIRAEFDVGPELIAVTITVVGVPELEQALWNDAKRTAFSRSAR